MSNPFTKDNIAPDSRLKVIVTPKGAFQGEFLGRKIWFVPTFCINCGKQGPDVPEENMRAFSYLCNGCFKTHGTALDAAVIPDQVFWEAVRQESLEQHGRELTHQELALVAAADASPLATLLQQGRI